MPSLTTPVRRCLTTLAAAALLLTAGCAAAPRARTSDEVPLRVMSWNIRYGGDDLDRIAAAIRDAGADVVALQEVDVHWSARSGFADQAAALAERLGMQVRFAPIYSLPGAVRAGQPREFGVALLSRHPIVRFRNDSLTRRSTQEPDAVPTRMPGLLHVTLDVRGTPVRVLDVHLDFRRDPAVRARQVDEMLAHLGVADLPTLVFGDLNAAPDAPELQPLFTRVRDTWMATAGAGLTYPAHAPEKRIDYVLASRHFRVRAADAPPTAASDHRPVVVDLLLLRRD